LFFHFHPGNHPLHILPAALPLVLTVCLRTLNIVLNSISTTSVRLLQAISEFKSYSYISQVPLSFRETRRITKIRAPANMPPALLIYASRKPGLSIEEFKDHYENKHVPLVKSLAGDLFPKSHTRYYFTKDATSGSEASHVIMGQPSDFPWDSTTILTFADDEHFNKCMAIMQDEEVSKKLAADEGIFTDRSSLKMVILGTVCQSVNESIQ
jgi:hypothetical protein